jgi:IS1 family transposase
MIVLNIDKFWVDVGEKKNNIRLIYVYHRESGEIVAYGGARGYKDSEKSEETDEEARDKL